MEEILQRLAKLSDAELRAELKTAGQPSGGIAKTTRKFFEKRLAKHLLASTGKVSTDTPDGPTKPKEQVQRLELNDGGPPKSSSAIADPPTGDATTTTTRKDSANEEEGSDGQFYVVQVPIDEMDVPDSPVFKAPLCSGLVYQNRKAALSVVKKSRGARFKVFKSQDEAETFINSHHDLSTPKRAAADTMHNTQSVNESGSSFRSPKNQQLVCLRKAIETSDECKFRELVWNNPRYLISSGDTPTIMKEGPRYNALHVTAIANLASMCKLIIETIGDPQFLALMYPDDNTKAQCKRQEVLVDMYLNTPDKGNCETALHFACKFGNPEVVRLLVDHPMCDKNVKNKYGQTPREIVCSRSGNEVVRKRIIQLLEDNYYVPLLRSQDNATQPVIGEPWSPDQTALHQVNSGIHLREGSPIDGNICTKAFAGPMSPSQAESFHKHLRTPPSAESKKAAAIRRVDGEKGLERVARELARSMHVPWAEHWDFLDAYVNLATEDGLLKLEEYLQARQMEQKKDITAAGGDQKARSTTSSNISPDIVSNLIMDFDNLSITSPESVASSSSHHTTDASVSPKEDPTRRTDNCISEEVSNRTSVNSDAAVNIIDTDSTYDTKVVDVSAASMHRSSDSAASGDRLPQSVQTMQPQGTGGKLDARVHGKQLHDATCSVSAISKHLDDDASGSINPCEIVKTSDSGSDKMELDSVSGLQAEGNDHTNIMVMGTPKLRQHPSNRVCDEESISVFLLGVDPTKLDIDVLRALSCVDNLDRYPCVQRWRQLVESMPTESRNSWPTPARYKRSRTMTTTSSHTPEPSPYRGYGSPTGSLTHNSPVSPLLMGSPYLIRSRHVSDPGMVGHRRVYTTTSPGRCSMTDDGQTGNMVKDPRLKLFP